MGALLQDVGFTVIKMVKKHFNMVYCLIRRIFWWCMSVERSYEEYGLMQNVMHILTRAVIIKDKKLLAFTGGKSYFLPGGHVEPGESVTAALEREIREELGVAGKIGRFLGCLETESIRAADHCCHHVHKCHDREYKFVFLVDVPSLSSAVVPQSPEEGFALEWIPLSQLSEIHLQPHALRNILVKWLEVDNGSALLNSNHGTCQK